MVDRPQDSSLTDWLESQPNVVRLTLLTRAAMRQFPLVQNELRRATSSEDLARLRSDVILRLYRAVSAAWITAIWSDPRALNLPLGNVFREVNLWMQSDSMDSNFTGGRQLAALSVDFASFWSSNPLPDTHIEDFDLSLLTFDTEGLDDIMRDRALLEEGEVRPEDLPLMPLFDPASPQGRAFWELPRDFKASERQVNGRESLASLWVDLRRHLLETGEGWEVWTDWFAARLRGGWTHGQRNDGENLEIEMARVFLEQHYWDQGAGAVNDQILHLISDQNYRRQVLGAHGIEIDGDITVAPQQDETEAPPQSETPATHARENVRTHADDPAIEDQLNRRPFAAAIVEKMNEVRRMGGRDGFAVHLHGPWGSGKTSILNFMGEYLTSDHEKPEDRWIVVRFNAWENERINPPWWPLLEAVNDGAKASFAKWTWIDGHRRQALRGVWHRWLRNTRWWPRIVFGSLAVVAGIIFLMSFTQASLGDWSKALGAVSSVSALLAVFSSQLMGLVHGSSAAAASVNQLSSDTMRPFIKIFSDLVETTGQPVVIFIDDLDRCGADYVVDLLEGVQTLFRHPQVAYVIAADRKWIRASFEARYAGFSAPMGRAGQPLGYLFLEKIFQISTTVPGMGRAGNRFWKGLLIEGAAGGAGDGTGQVEVPEPVLSPEVFDETVRQERRKISEKLSGETTQANLDAYVAEAGHSSVARAAAALELASAPAAQAESAHMLENYKQAVPENPRGMKRIVNAFGLRRAIRMLEGSTIPLDAMARWTIIEQRWPELADVLAVQPSLVDDLSKALPPKEVEKLPQGIRVLANDPDLIAALSSNQGPALGAAEIRDIVGH